MQALSFIFVSVCNFCLIQKIPELQKEIELLQTQKLDVERQAQSQKRELRGNLPIR